ncbi:defensin-like protein 1 [Tripterygium wilfordii]|uniref:defensin-like protein 1 n=1 Tax=Tripterygium wilfordii TaxID=458696 RepID=UPI0018F856EE|nr:defensin-like protein 1 [Tripterygium wilfordii]
MAAKAPKFAFFLAIFCILVFLVSAEVRPQVYKLCEEASKTWSGTCEITQHCDHQCRTWEHAEHGACHVRQSHHKCFCYFKCNN